MVNRKAAQKTLDAWRNGQTLEEALNSFVPQFDRTELAKRDAEHRQVSEIGERNLRMARAENLIPLTQLFHKGMSHLSKAVQARESRERQLIEALERGDLVALGFPDDRPKAAKPEPVPQFLIQREFAKFGKSEFSDGEKRFAKVRIVPANALAGPKIGRPSIRERVTEIASKLAEAGEINQAMLPKVQAGEIREYGKRCFPANFSENSPSEQTIKRHLKAFWNSK
jgi:hypothetical protein